MTISHRTHDKDPNDTYVNGDEWPQASPLVDPQPSIDVARNPVAIFKNLSATRRLGEMRKNMTNDSYIIPEMALAGQITLFYAKPNTGKTLFFLRFIIDTIRNGTISPDDFFYVNADDSYKGLLTKAEIAEKHGFSMISPTEAGMDPSQIVKLFDEMSKSDEIQGKIIFIDTLKKFADMMNKKSQANFFHVLRKLGAKNVTVIIAGHANKNLSVDGDLIYEGTSDTMSDIDCAYSMNRLSDTSDTRQVVEFRGEKDRGDVVAKVTYEYSKVPGMSYMDMLDSVAKVDDGTAAKIAQLSKRKLLEDEFESVLLFVKDFLTSGKKNQSEILTAYEESEYLKEEISRAAFKKGLESLDGISWVKKRNRANKNAMEYELIGAEANDYRLAKGE